LNKMDEDKYNIGIKRIEQAKRWIEVLVPMGTSTLPRRDVLAIVKEAVEGVSEVYEAIYEFRLDKDKRKKKLGELREIISSFKYEGH